MATKLIRVIEVPPEVVEAARVINTFASMYERDDEWLVEGLMPVSWATREFYKKSTEINELQTEITLMARELAALKSI